MATKTKKRKVDPAKRIIIGKKTEKGENVFETTQKAFDAVYRDKGFEYLEDAPEREDEDDFEEEQETAPARKTASVRKGTARKSAPAEE